MVTTALKHKKYEGHSSGTTATLEDALKNALVAAQKGENTNQFSWKLDEVHGDYGGFVGENIIVEIKVHH